MAPPVGLEPRPFATSIQFRRTLTAHFIVLRHNPPRSLHLSLAAVATRFPASAWRLAGSLVQNTKKTTQKRCTNVHPFALEEPNGLDDTFYAFCACSTNSSSIFIKLSVKLEHLLSVCSMYPML